MSIIKINKSKNIAGLIRYAQTPKDDQDAPRVLDSVCYGTTLSSAINDFKDTRKRFGKDKGYVQGYGLLVSWGREELNPDNATDVEKAKKFVQTFMSEYYDGHQYTCVLQADGKGHNLHAHVAINSVNYFTGKSLRGEQTRFYDVAGRSDALQKQMGIKNANKDNDLIAKDARKIAEIKAKDAGRYVWKDDLKARVITASRQAKNANEYQRLLSNMGVSINIRNSKKTKGGKMMTYSFTDKDNKQRKARENKLGSNYGFDAISAQLRQNDIVARRKQAEIARKQKEQEEELRREQQRQRQQQPTNEEIMPKTKSVDQLMAEFDARWKDKPADYGHKMMQASVDRANKAYHDRLDREKQLNQPQQSQQPQEDVQTSQGAVVVNRQPINQTQVKQAKNDDASEQKHLPPKQPTLKDDETPMELRELLISDYENRMSSAKFKRFALATMDDKSAEEYWAKHCYDDVDDWRRDATIRYMKIAEALGELEFEDEDETDKIKDNLTCSDELELGL